MTADPLAGFRRANENRTILACERNVAIARRILANPWPENWPPWWRAVAVARAGAPQASWQQVAETAGMTRWQATSAFWRMRERLAAADDGG